jgi:hypothetical protein
MWNFSAPMVWNKEADDWRRIRHDMNDTSLPGLLVTVWGKKASLNW